MKILIKKVLDKYGDINWLLYPDGNITQPIAFISDYEWERLVEAADAQREEKAKGITE